MSNTNANDPTDNPDSDFSLTEDRDQRQQQVTFQNHGFQPTLDDVWRLQLDIRNKLSTLERQQREQATAFPQNDLRKPDFDGHRRAHIAMIEEKKIMDGYKTDMTKKILTILIAFVLGLIATGFYSTITANLRSNEAAKTPNK